MPIFATYLTGLEITSAGKIFSKSQEMSNYILSRKIPKRIENHKGPFFPPKGFYCTRKPVKFRWKHQVRFLSTIDVLWEKIVALVEFSWVVVF